MKWVLGTGRCGMKNYTLWKQGYIHSDHTLRQIAVKKFHGEATDKEMEYAKQVFIERSRMPYPSVADCCQFMFIDLICFVDPAAEFVWLQRDREACIRSFMDRGAEEQRIHPKGWNFKYEKKRELLEWYYDTVNKTIAEGLMGRPHEKILTHEMPLLVAA